MTAIVPTVKLHLNKRESTFLVPLYITAMVAILSILISLLFWRSGSLPGTEGWIQGSRSNPGILYALAGFLVYFGVQSVATTFPFALTLGATRRAFTAGTLLWGVVTSAYLSIILAALCMIEIATNHWFAGFYIFDLYVLGAGDLSRLIPIVFLGTLTALSVGGVFGAAWVRFEARGPQWIAIGAAIVIVIALIIVIPSAEQIIAAFRLWWLAVAAIAVIAVSAAGTWLLLRPATVR